MQNFVKRLARRSRSAIIIYKIFDNRRLKKRIDSGDIETIHGSTHLNQSISDSLAYIEKQFSNHISYAGLSKHDLNGKRILELGPGDNLGVALKFLAAGAASVVCLDRFHSKRNAAHEREIYRELRETLDAEEKVRFDEALNLTDGVQFNPEKLRTIYGETLEAFAPKLEAKKFDLILSCAVLEEIYDLDPTFGAMDALLHPGGYLVHTIDLTDYGMFRNQGMHPLTFLTISEPVYKRMAADSGLPNRKRFGYYLEKMKQFGYQTKLFITSVLPAGRLEPAIEYVPGRFKNEASSGMITAVRNKLASEFKTLDEEELLIDGVLLVARKPL